MLFSEQSEKQRIISTNTYAKRIFTKQIDKSKILYVKIFVSIKM